MFLRILKDCKKYKIFIKLLNSKKFNETNDDSKFTVEVVLDYGTFEHATADDSSNKRIYYKSYIHIFVSEVHGFPYGVSKSLYHKNISYKQDKEDVLRYLFQKE